MRDRLASAITVLAVALFVVAAWLTGHPDNAIVDRAADWPGIGPLARRFREIYRPPPAPPPAARDTGPEVEIVTIWLPAEAPVPPPRSRTRVAAEPEPPGGEPPLGRAPEPVVPLPARAPDPARWQRAEALLGQAALVQALGPYRLLLDARLEPAPVARWSSLASALDAAFAERTGRAPLGEPAEGLVVFAEEADYRLFQADERRIAALATAGHASGGMAALWAGGRSADEVEATLVHELAHFVGRRAVGPALPPWLDEGLAEDLAQTPFDPARGRYDLGGLRVDLERSPGRVAIRGALAGLLRVASAEAAGRRTPLAELLALDADAFVAGDAPLRYAESLFLVRWLLDGGDPLAATALRGFLEEVARGESADGARLLARLGESAAVDTNFGRWIATESGGRLAAARVSPRR